MGCYGSAAHSALGERGIKKLRCGERVRMGAEFAYLSMTTTAATTSKSLWRLSGLTVWQLTRNAFAGLRRNDAIGRASQLAFDFLFALFPLILLIVTMFGIFASRSADLRNDFLSYFSNFLPPGAFEVLRTTTDELAMNASGG